MAEPDGLIVAVDAHYAEDTSTAALAAIAAWDGAAPLAERVLVSEATPAEYAPGALYRRELPPLEALLRSFPAKVQTIIVDGYVDLGPARPGLGAHLRRALEACPLTPGGRATPVPAVIGVAKTRFEGATHAAEVLRGESARPLFVTAAGVDRAEAAERVRGLPGAHRLPDLLRRADRLARRLEAPDDPTAERFAYKIVERDTWAALDPHAAWRGGPLDEQDGFIHLSRRRQLEGTLARHFAGRDDLLIVAIDLEAQPDLRIRWEPSRGGALFPHLYGPLPPRRAAQVEPVVFGPGGRPLPPDALP